MLSLKGRRSEHVIHHEEWSNDPVDEDAEADLLPHLPMGQDLVE
jgi:hypothetical protein